MMISTTFHKNGKLNENDITHYRQPLHDFVVCMRYPITLINLQKCENVQYNNFFSKNAYHKYVFYFLYFKLTYSPGMYQLFRILEEQVVINKNTVLLLLFDIISTI